MTVQEIDKFLNRLTNTEKLDDRSEYYKNQAIQYLKLYADVVEDRGRKRLKERG